MLKGFARRVRVSAAAGLLLLAQVIQIASPLIPTVSAAAGDPILLGGFTVIDADGANDQPNQKDITQMSTRWNNDGTVSIAWSWDETKWAGGNTGDGCALFDSNGNGLVDYTVCVTVSGNPASLSNTILYSCGDEKSDRCTNPIEVRKLATACTVSTTATDPFDSTATNGPGDAYPNDTTANCTIRLSDVGGGDANLLNACSYPSVNPNSDPSDCVRPITNGFLRIVKIASPDNTSAQFNFYISGTYFGSTFGSGTVTNSVITGTAYSLTETMPAGWSSVSATCDNGQSIASVTVATNQTVTCTFTNKQVLADPTANLNDPCGTDNAYWDNISTGNYTHVINADGSITFTANLGYVFSNNTTTYTIAAPRDSGELCNTELLPDPQPIDPCGLNNAYWDLAAIRAQYPNVTWAINEQGELVATANGVNFTDGRHSINFGTPVDLKVLCPVEIPTPPDPIDPCGPNNAHWSISLPPDTTQYTWELRTFDDGVHLFAVTTANYTFPRGEREHDLGLAQDSGNTCPAPELTPPTCTSAGSVTVADPKDGFSYYYTVTIGAQTTTYQTGETAMGIMQGSTVVVKLYRTEIGDDTLISTTSYAVPLLSCIAIPEEPKVKDPCGADNASWIVPSDTTEVTWATNNQGELVATAHGSLFTDGKTTHNYGKAVDKNVLCMPDAPTIEPICGLAPNDIVAIPDITDPAQRHFSYSFAGMTFNQDGTITYQVYAIADEGYTFENGERTITWTFTESTEPCEMPAVTWKLPACLDQTQSVTVIYDTDKYMYTISKDGGEEIPLASGTTILTTGTYTIHAYEYWYFDAETGPVYWSDPAFEESKTISTANGCGGYTPPSIPPVTILPTPTELPHTGSTGSGLLVALIAAIATYGAVYFAQPRRQHN